MYSCMNTIKTFKNIDKYITKTKLTTFYKKNYTNFSLSKIIPIENWRSINEHRYFVIVLRNTI